MIMLAANFFWHRPPVDVLVAAGEQPRKKALDWLMKFSSEKEAVADLSGERRLVRLRSAGFSGRDFPAHCPWREAMGGHVSIGAFATAKAALQFTLSGTLTS